MTLKRSGLSVFMSALLLAVPMSTSGLPRQTSDLEEISNEIELIRSTLSADLRPLPVHLIGGTAISVLDTATRQLPFNPRDIDLCFVLGQIPNAQALADLARRLGSNDSLSTLPIRRFDSAKPELIEVGKYVSIRAKSGRSFDLSFVLDPRAMELNGLVDIETTIVSLPAGLSLHALTNEKLDYESLLRRGLVIDPHQGYPSWQAGRLRVVRWGEIERAPLPSAVRLAHAAGKLNQTQLDELDTKKLRKLIEENSPNEIDLIRFEGRLKRLRTSPNSEKKLQLLENIGALKKHELQGPGSCSESLARLAI